MFGFAQAVFSNLEAKPVQDGREGDETEEGFAEFFVAGADSPQPLDAGEEVFDDVAMGIEQLRVVVLDSLEQRAGMQGRALTASRSRRKVAASKPRSPMAQQSASSSISGATACRSLRLPAARPSPIARPSPSTTAANLVFGPP
jgi:hypothetical protein